MPNTVTFISASTEHTYDYDTQTMYSENGCIEGFRGWSPAEVDKSIATGFWVVIRRSGDTSEIDILKENRQF